ncbi:mitochondrial ribosomal small subunit component [Xanthoria parietina]
MARAATILPNFIGLKFQVHNGKVYNDVTITEDMVGHKLGEFSPTRKIFSFKQTKNK